MKLINKLMIAFQQFYQAEYRLIMNKIDFQLKTKIGFQLKAKLTTNSF